MTFILKGDGIVLVTLLRKIMNIFAISHKSTVIVVRYTGEKATGEKASWLLAIPTPIQMVSLVNEGRNSVYVEGV